MTTIIEVYPIKSRYDNKGSIKQLYMAAIYYYNRSIYLKGRTDQNLISSLSTFNIPTYTCRKWAAEFNNSNNCNLMHRCPAADCTKLYCCCVLIQPIVIRPARCNVVHK